MSSVSILGSTWFSAMPAVSPAVALEYVQELARSTGQELAVRLRDLPRHHTPVIGIVLVLVDPPAEHKAYIGLAGGFNREADERFIAEWGAEFPTKIAQNLLGWRPQ